MLFMTLRIISLVLVALLFCVPVHAASNTVFEHFTLDAPIPDTFQTGTLYKISGVATASTNAIDFRWSSPTKGGGFRRPINDAVSKAIAPRSFTTWIMFSEPGVYDFKITSSKNGDSADSFFIPKQSFPITVQASTGASVQKVPEEFLLSYFGRLKFAQPVTLAATTIDMPLLILDLRGARSKVRSIELTFIHLQGDVLPQFKDDGRNGDAVAGDDIYSVQLPDCEITSSSCIYPEEKEALSIAGYGQYPAWANVTYENGETENFSTLLGLLAADTPLVSIEQLSGSAFRTERLLNIVDTTGEMFLGDPTINMEKVAKRFYEIFPDRFDFLFFRLDAPRKDGYAGYHFNINVDFDGTGARRFDSSKSYGSSGSLKGGMYLSFQARGPIVHELMHQWANHAALLDGGYAGHWGRSNANGVLGGDVNFAQVTSLGNDLYSIPGQQGCCSSYGGRYSPLELYMAGLAPASQVPPVTLLKNSQFVANVTDSNGNLVSRTYRSEAGIATYTIDDIIKQLGRRTPAYGAAQTQFSAATIVLSAAPIDQLTATWFDLQMKFLSSDTANDGSFAYATGYRATLDTKLGLALGPNTPPVVAISGGSRTVADTNAAAGESVALTATATDSDGTIASTQWLVNGQVVATGTSATISLADGATVVTFRATDNSGATTNKTATITVGSVEAKPADYLGTYNGVAVDPRYNLEVNQVGLIIIDRSRLHSCVRIFENSQPAQVAGMNKIDVTFNILSLDTGAIQIVATRPFSDQSSTDAQPAECSGRFETTTGIYRDYINLGTQLFDASFRLVNDSTLEFSLVDAKEVLIKN
jgi:hypothetical protein